jgi:hypothetical protein
MQTPNPTAKMSDNSPYAQCTPGPWLIKRDIATGTKDITRRWKIVRPDGRIIAEVIPCKDVPFSMRDTGESGRKDWVLRECADARFSAEDARLIAAAPMLLQEVAALQATNAALRAALEAAVARVELANPILSAWLPDARAALAGQEVQS